MIIKVQLETAYMEKEEEESYLSNCRESTARGMFSWSGEQVDLRGGCALYMMARSTAETVGMYAVLLRASSHVSPISWQSRPSILLALSPSPPSLSPFVPFLPSPFSCKYHRGRVSLDISSNPYINL